MTSFSYSASNPIKIGIYGGSFDPVHFGHVNLTLELMEKADLNEVWIIPANQSPFKIDQANVSQEQRFKMCELAFADIPKISVHNNELLRPHPSYTIDTIEEIYASNQKKQFFLMLGQDALVDFAKWHRVIDLVQAIPLLIGERRGAFNQDVPLYGFEGLPGGNIIKKAIAKGRTQTRFFDVSSTEIRERVTRGLYCGHLVPAKVLDYIYENKLYYKS